jgi:hypothetical protein
LIVAIADLPVVKKKGEGFCVDILTPPFLGEILIDKCSGPYNLDTAIAGYPQQLLIAADNNLGLACQGAREKLVIVGIVTNWFGQRRGCYKLCFCGKQVQDRIEVNAVELFRQNSPHPLVFLQNLRGDNDMDDAVAPCLKTMGGRSGKENA